MSVFAHVGVNISVGNAAVQTAEDVADLLVQAASKVRATSIGSIDRRSIMLFDYNGNPVGDVQVTGYEEIEDEDEESQTVRGFPYKPGAF